VPASEFPGWLARVRDAGAALDIDTYAQLARTSSDAKTHTFASVDPNLFERIVQQTVQPATTPRKED
jgi:cytochrome o ubiquinol oxidase subunit 2